jgi:Pyridoxal-dependent decarboxylase conserved domain
MDSEEFRQRGREMVDYIVEYMETLGERRVTPSVEPGYLREMIPKNAPKEGEKWEEIMSDVESKIMPGVSTNIFIFEYYCTKYANVEVIVVLRNNETDQFT